jgi:hypothetical protein
VVEEELKALGIEGGEFQREARSGKRFHRAVQIQALEPISGGHQGLDAAGGNTMAENGQEATATFILGPEAPLPIAVLLRPDYTGLELGVEGRLEVDDGLRLFFGCARRGDLGLACNW